MFWSENGEREFHENNKDRQINRYMKIMVDVESTSQEMRL